MTLVTAPALTNGTPRQIDPAPTLSPRQVAAEITHLQPREYTFDEVKGILPHQGKALKLRTFRIAKVEEFPTELVERHQIKQRAIGDAVGVGTYTFSPEECDGHFSLVSEDPAMSCMIVPAHYQMEFCALTGAALLRCLPSCRPYIATFDRETRLTPKQMLLPGYPAEAITWLEDIYLDQEGHCRGRAQALCRIDTKLTLTLDFQFMLVNEEKLIRAIRVEHRRRTPRSERNAA